ncbi:SEL1-like repeat protein [Alysiella crassa]|uniref:Sel1 repeat n=1 Tax=Alysiella crassa TaxID=153491 RepID=A0A376BKU0_9NEIS|nr:SEL1-like repeat protein [Alysiella crassa]UOP07425.1 SEL1-like repeat protein [Alysiella crassa]SSY70387.1 Sel1 repeat [Alysiella crassa]
MTSEFHPFKQLLASAQAGDADCYKAVAVCYSTAYGVAADEEQALYWYKKAWKHQHHSEIAIAIAHIYFNQNSTRNAVYWLEKAVDLGNPNAALEYVQHLMTRKKLKSDALLWQLLTKVLASPEIDDLQRNQTLDIIKQLSEL